MPRQTPRLATGGIDDVDVGVPTVLHAERDLLPVGREMRIRFRSWKARKSLRVATVATHDPDIARVGEGNLRTAHRRLAQQPRALSRHQDGDEHQSEEDGCGPHDAD